MILRSGAFNYSIAHPKTWVLPKLIDFILGDPGHCMGLVAPGCLQSSAILASGGTARILWGTSNVLHLSRNTMHIPWHIPKPREPFLQ